ncbi:MAG: hypothetical protein IPK03_16075 [Bacteroidetes bacterium]|nr:hypothetical protein [Bacteroidota bacterium]
MGLSRRPCSRAIPYYVQDSTCIPSATRTAILVTVNNLPTVTANATDTIVCAGKSVTLNGGGTATSFAWSGGKTNGVSFIPTLSTNSYTVTGTGANGCSDTAVITIQVKSLPTVTANASDTLVCAGKSVTLNGGGTATSFAWSGGKTNGVSFIPTLSTNSYTVTGTGANGCSDTAKITIQVKSLPTVTANASDTLVCAGKSVTLNGGETATSFA